jgi:hypothetical protein
MYAVAAAIAGAIFVAGSALYVHLVPAPAPASPEIQKPLPLKLTPATVPIDPKPALPSEEKDQSLVSQGDLPLVSQGESGIPFATTIGARVFDVNRNEIGMIKDFTLTPVGEAKVEVMKLDGKLVTVPAEWFVWKFSKPLGATPAGGAVSTTPMGYYKVEAIAKKPFQLQ